MRGRPQDGREVGDVDDHRAARAVALGDPDGRLAQDFGQVPFEVADTRLPGVVVDDRGDRRLGHLDFTGPQAGAIDQAGEQVVAGDGQLLGIGVAVETDDLHAVEQRPGDRLEGDVDGPVRWTVEPGLDGVDDGFSGAGDLSGDALVERGRQLGLRARNPDAAFVRAVASGAGAYPAIAEAVAAHDLADAAYRSARAGGAPVPIPTAGSAV